MKIIYLISNIDKALEFEWVVNCLSCEFDFFFILLNPTPSYLFKYLKNKKIPVYEITYRGKKDFLKVFLKCFKLIRHIKPDILHCHLLDASLIGLPIGRLLGIKKNIYTRHHSTYHHVYYPHAVKYDKFCNCLATKIVAVSELVKDILIQWENAPENKVKTILHGIDINFFENIKETDITNLKEKYLLRNRYPVIGVISRYVEWKGIQYIIPAFTEILKKYPNAMLILANAKKGDYTESIERQLAFLPKENFIEIEFEPQINVLYKLFDVFVHVPIDEHSEAFGQIYIEALISEVPSVFTASGIGNLIKNLDIADFIEYKNSLVIEKAIIEILNDYPLKKKKIRDKKAFLKENFCLENKIENLRQLYVTN